MGEYENKDRGNFYPKVVEGTDWHCDYLWGTHRGCPFDCFYCSSKRLNVRFGGDPCEVRRLKTEWVGNTLKRKSLPLGFGYFINPHCDIANLPREDMDQVFNLCQEMEACGMESESTKFIVQTKKPDIYFDYLDMIPKDSWLGTTIETSCWLDYEFANFTNAPNPNERYNGMVELKRFAGNKFKYFVTIEPIMITDGELIKWMEILSPDVIFIGGNTSKVKLPEPTPDEVVELVESLRQITTVHCKSNLERLLPSSLHSWFKEIKRM